MGIKDLTILCDTCENIINTDVNNLQEVLNDIFIDEEIFDKYMYSIFAVWSSYDFTNLMNVFKLIWLNFDNYSCDFIFKMQCELEEIYNDLKIEFRRQLNLLSNKLLSIVPQYRYIYEYEDVTDLQDPISWTNQQINCISEYLNDECECRCIEHSDIVYDKVIYNYTPLFIFYISCIIKLWNLSLNQPLEGIFRDILHEYMNSDLNNTTMLWFSGLESSLSLLNNKGIYNNINNKFNTFLGEFTNSTKIFLHYYDKTLLTKTMIGVPLYSFYNNVVNIKDYHQNNTDFNWNKLTLGNDEIINFYDWLIVNYYNYTIDNRELNQVELEEIQDEFENFKG